MEIAAFVAKKLISALLYPVPMVFLICLAGYLLLLKGAAGKWRRRVAGLGLVLFFLLSLPLTGWLALRPLELMAGDYADPQALARSGVKHVVVLGGAVWQGERPPADSLSGASMRRLMEGIRLWRGLENASLVVSGGSPLPGRNVGTAMADLALQLGLPKEAVILENDSFDTADQARILAQRLGGRPFALVTSAAHMPRSVAEFRKLGLAPLPAPADFRTKGLEWSWRTLLPQASGFGGVRMAMHEYLGLAWFHIKNLFA